MRRPRCCPISRWRMSSACENLTLAARQIGWLCASGRTSGSSVWGADAASCFRGARSHEGSRPTSAAPGASPPVIDQPRILFLFSDTGGGHRSATEAIIEAVEHGFPGRFHAEVIDVLADYAPRPLNRLPQAY